MVALDTGQAGRWTLARCPVHGHVLGEVRGRDAELRKKCTQCHRFWIFEHRTGRYTMEPATATCHREEAVLAMSA